MFAVKKRAGSGKSVATPSTVVSATPPAPVTSSPVVPSIPSRSASAVTNSPEVSSTSSSQPGEHVSSPLSSQSDVPPADTTVESNSSSLVTPNLPQTVVPQPAPSSHLPQGTQGARKRSREESSSTKEGGKVTKKVRVEKGILDEETENIRPPDPVDGEPLTMRHLLHQRRTGIPMPSSVRRKEAQKKSEEAGEDASAKGETTEGILGRDKAVLEEEEIVIENGVVVSRTKGGSAASSDGSGQGGGEGDADGGQSSQYRPEVRIVDGNIVIDDRSALVMPRQEAEHMDYSVVHEHRSYVTSRTYAKYAPSDRWSEKDTEDFYKCLQECGTDFSLMELLFPGRTRRQLRNKFKLEERCNPERIEEALSNPVPMDAATLKAVSEVPEK